MANSPSGSLDRAFEELIQRIVASTMNSVRADLSRIAASSAAPGLQPVAAPAADGRIAALHHSISSILAPTSQTEIMAAALKSSASVSGAAALFVRRGDTFTTWRSEGLAADQANGLRSLNASAASDGAFRDMCEGIRSISADPGSSSWPAGMNSLAVGSANICLMPILVAGKVVAAIAAAADGSQDSAASLEIIARLAGLSLETSGARAAAPAPQSVAAPAPPAPAPAVPPAASTAEPQHAPAAVTVPDPSRGSFAEMSQTTSTEPTPDISGLAEADQDAHKKAHRFARVAVQDLLSYHKSKIAEGRNNRNLYDLLREDIEKTRENYQKKFASTAAASFDYLHYELVAKLAGNDPEVLGANYPGPVSA
jgi:hypothetical protein